MGNMVLGDRREDRRRVGAAQGVVKYGLLNNDH
jgi:hypothetical protein